MKSQLAAFLLRPSRTQGRVLQQLHRLPPIMVSEFLFF